MFSPRPDLARSAEHPPLAIGRWQWLFAAIIRPLIECRLKALYHARMERAETLLNSVGRCKSRESLESLLGPPKYALEGHLCLSLSADGLTATQPDVVEVYQKDGCQIELWFKDDKMMSMSGTAYPTRWEIVTGAVNGDAG